MKGPKVPGKRAPRKVVPSTTPDERAFAEVVEMIEAARGRAVAAVNTTLVDLYWRVGEYISRKLATATWGEGVVDALALYIQRRHQNLRGFTRRNLFRMRQFFDAYSGQEKVSALLTQLPWTHHLLILGRSKRAEEREFYIRLAIQEKWSSRELERQINSALFERVVLSPTKLSAPLRELHPDAASIFKDAYFVEFLELPSTHSEADLQRALVEKLKHFLIELGRDFCFIGSQYPIQVGGRDFAIDLVFFNRALNCLVAFELKVVEFEPEHLGKLQFYLEALDRDVKKPHEQPSIGILLCATKNNEVVEYALSRSMSPALVSEYQTRLPGQEIASGQAARVLCAGTVPGRVRNSRGHCAAPRARSRAVASPGKVRKISSAQLPARSLPKHKGKKR